MIAQTKKGTKVALAFVDDVEPNEGGFYVEVYDGDMMNYIDNFCVHPYDCDCTDINKVEDFARDLVAEIEEY